WSAGRTSALPTRASTMLEPWRHRGTRATGIATGLMCLLLVGCAGTPTQREPVHDSLIESPAHGLTPQKARVLAALDSYYAEWAGVPYRLGGESRTGIDCSAFVQQALSSINGMSLPRTTRGQARQGDSIPRSQLQIGDLVFF